MKLMEILQKIKLELPLSFENRSIQRQFGEAIAEFEKFRERLHKTMNWMVEDMKWRHNETKRNFEDGSEGGYSPELKEAISLLGELKPKNNQKTRKESQDG